MKRVKKGFLIILACSLASLALVPDANLWANQTISLENPPNSFCAFCDEKILQAQTFYETDHARALVTYKPVVGGHVLIIPQRHVERFEGLTADELIEMGEIIKKVDQAVKNLYGNTGSLLLQKNGPEAGQSVPHVHFHYLPRKEGDSHLLFALRFFIAPYLRAIDSAEMERITNELRSEMNRIER